MVPDLYDIGHRQAGPSGASLNISTALARVFRETRGDHDISSVYLIVDWDLNFIHVFPFYTAEVSTPFYICTVRGTEVFWRGLERRRAVGLQTTAGLCRRVQGRED